VLLLSIDRSIVRLLRCYSCCCFEPAQSFFAQGFKKDNGTRDGRGKGSVVMGSLKKTVLLPALDRSFIVVVENLLFRSEISKKRRALLSRQPNEGLFRDCSFRWFGRLLADRRMVEKFAVSLVVVAAVSLQKSSPTV
jgi:hypothetical protein